MYLFDNKKKEQLKTNKRTSKLTGFCTTIHNYLPHRRYNG